MDARTSQFVSYVYDTVLKPYPNVKKYIKIKTPGFLSNFIYDFLKTTPNPSNPVNTSIQVLSNEWMENPEMVVQLYIALMQYIRDTKPMTTHITMNYKMNEKGTAFLLLKTIKPMIVGTNETNNDVIEIPIEPFQEDTVRATIRETILEWKLKLLDRRYSPKKLSTPLSKQECVLFDILKQSTDLTCWANTVINAFLISINMRRMAIVSFNRYKMDVLNTLPLDKQQAFYNPESMCILPKSLMTDTVERFAIMQFLYKAICFYEQTVKEGDTNPQLLWNKRMATAFKKTQGSFLSTLSQVFGLGNIGFVSWAIKGFLKNIYGEERYKTCVKEDVSYTKWIQGGITISPDTEIVLTGTVSPFPIIREVRINGQRYVLDHVAIFITKNIVSMHYLAGVLCGDMPYVLDTGNINVAEVNWVDGDFSLIQKTYTLGKLDSIQISYACYVKDIQYNEEPVLDCTITRNVMKHYEVKQAMAALPPVSIRRSSRKI